MLTFNKSYFRLAILLFIIEVLIALFVRDNFIRPYFGDVLVVMLLYCFFKSFFRMRVLTAALFVLVFSFGIECFQFLQIVEKLDLENSVLASTIIGTSFAWQDLLAYVAGLIIVLIAEKYWHKKSTTSK